MKIDLKGNSGQRISYAQMKEDETCKRWVVTDFNAPNGSRDIQFLSRGFEQDVRRQSVGFQPRFQINMTSQTLSCKTVKKMKVQCLKSLLICLKFCLKLSKRISVHFKFCCYGKLNRNNKPLFKTKRLWFSHYKKSVSPIFFPKNDSTCSNN